MPFDLATIDALIGELLANQKVDYTIGDKSVKNSQKLVQALNARKAFMEDPVGDQAIIAFDALNINEFGVDSTEFV